MDHSYNNTRGGSLNGRPRAARMNPTRRSGTINGMNYTMETSSFSQPGTSFQSFSGTSGTARSNAFSSTNSNARSQGGGLVSAAFDLLGDVLSSRQQQAQARNSTRRRNTQPYVEDLAYGDDDYTTSNQQPSLISKFADRLLSSSQRARGSSVQHGQPSRPSAPRRANTEQTPRSHVSNEQARPSGNGRKVYVEEDLSESEYDDTDSEDSESSIESQPRRAFTVNDVDLIEALENAAEHHRREARTCRRKFERASRESRNTSTLQAMLNEIKGHEKAYENAQANLKSMRSGDGGSSRRHSSYQGRPPQQRRSSGSTSASFNRSTPNGFHFSFQTRGSSHPMFADLDHFAASSPLGGAAAFDHFFADSLFDHHAPFLGIPRSAFGGGGSRFGFSNRPAGFTFEEEPRVATFSPPLQTPPANLLKPEEAKRLFEVYNERWNALAATDPSIPYPARGLKATALNARDTIWAPTVNTAVQNWSEEATMKANAQAFFLGVVSLVPDYTEAPGTGRVVMGYNKSQGSPLQVKQLVDILKKEKMRWHSDRLGRRNGGAMTGPNESLQTNERARAVFHAVCELMEFAQ